MTHPLPASIDTPLTAMLGIRYPIIMAPMFLVSDANMVIAALKAGITGAIPALNWRSDEAMRQDLERIRKEAPGPIGINLIVNKSNFRLAQQLQTCVDLRVEYIITSLGSPAAVIEACAPKGIKVFCDVVDEQYAQKVEALGADALIGVNREAGGHAGPRSASVLIPALTRASRLPVISAGGVGRGDQLAGMLDLGACGVSMGSPFIATVEAPVSEEYKQACVDYGAADIVMTTRLSGTPCTIINTPYVEKIGTQQNKLEAFLNKNRQFKKIAKALTFYKGMKALEKAAFSATYKTLWCAGPSIEYVDAVRPIEAVVHRLVSEYAQARTGVVASQ
ncbi:MAG: nitronate monooxygenase [Bacteroidetes bacterium]|nr:nitronate monooxygenase [Bacteroidota bacterium]